MKFKAVAAALCCILLINTPLKARPATEFLKPVMLNPQMAIAHDSVGFGEFLELSTSTFITNLSVPQFDTVILPLKEPDSLSSLINAYGRENITITIASPAQNGMVSVNKHSDFQFASDVVGSDKVILSYSAFGALLGNIIIDITVADFIAEKTNQLPVVKDIAYESRFGQAITFDPSSNDYDPNGDALSVVLAPSQGNIEHGALSQNGNLLTFAPYNDDFSGGQIIYYRVHDSHGSKSNDWRRAIIYLRQPKAISLPLINNDSAMLAKGQTITIDALHNDLGVDGYSLNVTMWSQEKVFEIIDNKIKYTADNDFSGIAYLYYSLTDSSGDTLKWSNGNVRYGAIDIAIHD